MPRDVQRDLGRLEARQESAEDRLARIESKMDQVLEYMASSKGAWRMLIGVGGLAATLAAGITEALHWLWSGK